MITILSNLHLAAYGLPSEHFLQILISVEGLFSSYQPLKQEFGKHEVTSEVVPYLQAKQ